MFGSFDYVPPSLPNSYGKAKLYVMEDNDAVIQMCVKERSPALRHVSRTHRVDLVWLFERINKDPGVLINLVPAKEELADILTKGSFTAEAWNSSCKLCLSPPRSSRKQRLKLSKHKQHSTLNLQVCHQLLLCIILCPWLRVLFLVLALRNWML